MPFMQWIDDVLAVKASLEARYGMRIDWAYYDQGYVWVKAYRSGLSPCGALAEAMTQSGKLTEYGTTRFNAEIAAVALEL